MGNSLIVSKLEKAFVNYVLEAGLLDKEEIRRICIEKKKNSKKRHLAQLAVNENYLTQEQAREILREVKQEMQDIDPQDYDEIIENTLEVYGINLEQIISDQKKDFSKPEDRYVPLKEVGRGGMGIVEKVWDNVLQREAARKTILVSQAAQDDESKKEEVIRKTQRAKNEARLTGKLSHPYIIKVHDSGRDAENNFFYVMEFVENGKELTDVIDQIADIKRKGKKIPNKFAAESVLEMVAQVCDGMDYAHKQGVIHRDLKPENVMVYGSSDKLFMLIVDWGLAKDLEKRELVLPAELSDKDLKGKLKEAIKGRSQEIRTADGQVMGTLKYMAPEQALGAEKTDEKSDIFALGAILYETLTGQAPRDLQGKNVMQALHAIAHQEIEDAREAKSPLFGITPGLAAICAKAMRINPAKRYKTAGQMARDIRNYLEHKELIAKPDGFFEKWYKKAIRNPLKAGMAATAAVLLPLALGGVGVVRGISAQNELRLETKARQEAEKAAESEKERADLAVKLGSVHKDKAEALRLNNDAQQKIDYARNITEASERSTVLQETIALLQRARELDDKYAAICHNLGVAYELLGETDKALQFYDAALAVDENYGKSYFGRATIRMRTGNLDGAIEDYEATTEILPLMTEAYINLGLCYMKNKDYARAIKNCNKALDIKPKHPTALKNKGASHAYLKQYSEAETWLKKAIVHGDYEAHLSLAKVYLFAKDKLHKNWRERAREHCNEAVSIDKSLAKEAQEILEKIK